MTTYSRLVVASSQGRKGGFHLRCAGYEGFQRVQQLRRNIGLLPFLIDRGVAVGLGQKPKTSIEKYVKRLCYGFLACLQKKNPHETFPKIQAKG